MTTNREAIFLTTHLHTPIFYLRQQLKGYHTMQFEFKSGELLEHVITNLAHIFVDVDQLRDTKTSKSVSYVIAAIHKVTIH